MAARRHALPRAAFMGRIRLRRLLVGGFVASLGLLAFVHGLPSDSDAAAPVFFVAALALGVGAVAGLAYSPKSHRTGSIVVALPLVFLAHGMLTIAALHRGYYPRFLAGGYLGQAFTFSVLFVFVEWGAVIAIGPFFATKAPPTVPVWLVAGVVVLLGIAINTPGLLYRSLDVVQGPAPTGHWHFTVDPKKDPPTALIEDVLVQARQSDDHRSCILHGWDIRNDRRWTVDLTPSEVQFRTLYWPSFVKGSAGEVVVVQEIPPVGPATDELGPFWVVSVNVHAGSVTEAEVLEEYPLEGIEECPTCRPLPVGDASGVLVDRISIVQPVEIAGPGFVWRLTSRERVSPEFSVGTNVLVMKELRADRLWYHIFLLPK